MTMNLVDQVLFSVEHSALSSEAAIVDQGLGDFNSQTAALQTVEPLACLAKFAHGEVIGGAVGRTWGECCELQQLWVAQAYRKRGVGSELVQQFEAAACSRGCRTFYLETFSFQSPEFYQKLGYEVKVEICGFPDHICKYVMIKQQAPS